MPKISKPAPPEPVLPQGDVFVTVRNSDLTEGRGRRVDHEYFDDLDDAVAGAKGIDVQGSDGEVWQITQLLPEKRVKVWGRNHVPGFPTYISYTGFTPESGRFDDGVLQERLRQTEEYKKYVELKEKFEPYGLA